MNHILKIGIPCLLAYSVGWFFWVPVYRFFLSMIPPGADYAWVGKLIVTFVIAYFGGIAVPLIVLFIGLMVAYGAHD